MFGSQLGTGDYGHLTIEHVPMLMRNFFSLKEYTNQGFEATHSLEDSCNPSLLLMIGTEVDLQVSFYATTNMTSYIFNNHAYALNILFRAVNCFGYTLTIGPF